MRLHGGREDGADAQRPRPRPRPNLLLPNSREMAVACVKDGNPTFHGQYDNGFCDYPVHGTTASGFIRRRNPRLFAELVDKHGARATS